MINPFKLEVYLSQHEFSAQHLLCCSDAQSMKQSDLLALATKEQKELWENLELGYTQVRGHSILRAQIARAIYTSVTPEQIMCFAGAEEAIFCTLYTLLCEQDHFIILTPCYQSLFEIPKLKTKDFTRVVLKEERGFEIDLDEIQKSIRPNTKLVIINFPHNPTCQCIPQETLVELVKMLEYKGIWLLADEVYRGLYADNSRLVSNACDLYDRSISLGGMSKSFGLPGLRIGWIGCKDRGILDRIEKTKHYTSICISAPSEILGIIALSNTDIIWARNNAIIKENMNLLDAFIEKYSSFFSWKRPQGGCTGLIKCKAPLNARKLAHELLESKSVLILSDEVYDMDCNSFRIGFGRSDMRVGLELFDEFLRDAYPHQ